MCFVVILLGPFLERDGSTDTHNTHRHSRTLFFLSLFHFFLAILNWGSMDGVAVTVDRIPRVLRFNVGGTVYMTSMGTLEARGPNFLTTLVGQHYGGESGMRCEVVDGALFIDRSGVAFEYVLHFLRTGNLVCGGSTSVEMLRDELAFYAIPLDLEESSKVSVSHARSLFDITEETNQSYVEAARFIETLWPLLHPFLLDRAKKGFSFALFTIKKAVVPGGNVSYR